MATSVFVLCVLCHDASGSASLARAARFAEPHHGMADISRAAGGAFQAVRGELDLVEIAPFPYQRLDRQSALVAARLAAGEPDPARRRMPKASQGRLPVWVLSSHHENR